MNAFKNFALACVSAALVACGGGGSDPEVKTTVVDSANAAVAKFTLTPSARTLKADGKETITWAIYALTTGNGAVKGAKIDLAATNGVILGASQVTTPDTGGGATVTMIADSADQRNRTATLTASCADCAASSANSEITVVGATLSLVNSPDTNLVVGSSTGATLKATLKDAMGAVMPGVPLSLGNTDPLVLSLSASSAVTDSTGSASVLVKGLSTGAARVNVSALGAVASSEYASSSPANALTITSPTAGTAFTLGNPAIPIVASAPGATSIVFSATSGTFDKTTVTVANGVANSLFTPSQAGSVTITVSDGKKTSSTDINVSPPVTAVTKLFLSASQSTLPLSSNGVTQSLKVTATALTDQNQAVANVPISFTWSGGPGAGEKLTPALAYTDASGKAYATFFAGTAASTPNAIKVNARFVNPTTGQVVMTGTSPSSNGLTLTIDGEPLSVSFGAASALTESADKTLYTSSYSVQVTGAGNSPMANQLVTLSMQPVAFSLGSSCTVTKTYCAEDRNGNGLLDSAEDGGRLSIGITEPRSTTVTNADGTTTTTTVDVETSRFDISKCTDPLASWTTLSINKNGLLTPQNSDGGSVPSVVTTNKNGIATFDLTYLKGSALWVVNQLTATVSSAGTETSKSTVFRLAASTADVKLPDTCFIPDSPYSN